MALCSTLPFKNCFHSHVGRKVFPGLGGKKAEKLYTDIITEKEPLPGRASR